MNRDEFYAWIEENGTGHVERKSFNGIDYAYAIMKDGWIAIFEVDGGYYLPRIQSADEPHADSWCDRREAIRVPLQAL